MSHPLHHSISSVKKYGGIIEDYISIHNWFDETKAWVGHSKHRMFRHHSEGIFECEQRFGMTITNSDGKQVYVRYIGEQHVKEDCFGYIPSAKEWVRAMESGKPEEWMIRTLKIED